MNRMAPRVERDAAIISLAMKGTRPMDIAEKLRVPKGTVYFVITNARKRGCNIPKFPTGAPPGMTRDFCLVRIAAEDVMALAPAAHARGILPTDLVKRLIREIAAADLVDAVLDDGHPKC